MSTDLTPVDYGAAGDGTTDDTSAFNLWIAALNSGPTAIGCIPPGSYRIDGNLDAFTRSVSIYGSGTSSGLLLTSATAEGFDFQASLSYLTGCQIMHVNAQGGTDHTAGWLVKFSHPTELNRGSEVQRVLFFGGICQLHIDACTGFKSIGCLYFDPKAAARSRSVRVENSFNEDAGDNHFIGNTFACSGENSSDNRIGIEHISSGGIYLSSNKFLYFEYHYALILGSGVSTSISVLNGNSFENAQSASLIFFSEYANNGFESVAIAANHFASNALDIFFAENENNPDWVSTIRISDNVSRKSVAGIRMESGKGVVIGGTFDGLAGLVGIETTGAVDDVRLGHCKFAGTWTTPYSLSSTNTVIDRYPIAVDGSANLTIGAWGGSGLYYGKATINLPAPFPGGIANANIRVEIKNGGGAGIGVAGMVDAIISETSFDVVILGASSGGSVPFRVVAEGY